MTPEERASQQLAEELGFSIQELPKPIGATAYLKVHETTGDSFPVTPDEWEIWSLCVRQRVRLNEVEKGT